MNRLFVSYQYHTAAEPKCRQKNLYGKLKRDLGEILRDLCRQRGVDLLEGHLMADHVRLCFFINAGGTATVIFARKSN